MTHVLCFGNLWQGDDGFGIHVCRRLQAILQQGGVRVFEVGLRALDALPLFEHCRRVILVDALYDPQSQPGSVRRLDRNAILPAATACPHSAGVAFLMQALLAQQTTLPEITLVGAVAARITPFSDRLSPALTPAVAAVTDEIMQILPPLAIARVEQVS